MQLDPSPESLQWSQYSQPLALDDADAPGDEDDTLDILDDANSPGDEDDTDDEELEVNEKAAESLKNRKSAKLVKTMDNNSDDDFQMSHIIYYYISLFKNVIKMCLFSQLCQEYIYYYLRSNKF